MSLTVLLNGRQMRSMQLCDANQNHAHSTEEGHETLEYLDTCNACRAHSVANLGSQHLNAVNETHRRLSNEFLSLEPLLKNGAESLTSNGRLQRAIRRDVRDSPEKEKTDENQQDKTKLKEQRIVDVVGNSFRKQVNKLI